MSETNPQVQQHLSQVSESLTKENRLLMMKLEEMEKRQEELEKEHQEMDKARLAMEEEKKSLEDKFNEANKLAERVKAEKRTQLETVIQNEINPYLEKLAESNKENPRLLASIDNFKKMTEDDLQTGDFLDDKKENNLMLVHAMASAGQVTSSKLDEIFQARKDWENKMEEIKNEKTKLEQTYQETTEEQKKEIEKLKKQLEDANNNIKNVDSHFDQDSKKNVMEENRPENVLESTPAITAIASNDNSTGYNSLYKIQPINWRSKYANAEEAMRRTKFDN